MAVTASALRQNIYKILDGVAETGIPQEVIRRGKLLRIVPVEKKSRLSRVKKRPIIQGDPEDLVSMDWSHLWKP
jgi:prevent-host-death family protein